MEIKACVVKHKDTGEMYKFTLGDRGEIVIIEKEEYDIDDLIVSLVPAEEVAELDKEYYIMLGKVENG